MHIAKCINLYAMSELQFINLVNCFLILISNYYITWSSMSFNVALKYIYIYFSLNGLIPVYALNFTNALSLPLSIHVKWCM